MDEFIEIRDVGSISQCQHPACSKEQLNTKNEKTIRTCGDNVSKLNKNKIIYLTFKSIYLFRHLHGIFQVLL